MAISAGSYFLKALLVLLAELPDPFGRALFEFRVVFVFPSAGRGFQGCNLTQAHQLAFGRLGYKTAAPAAADNGIDVFDELLGEHYVRAFDIHKG
jgi:hypothetical protein